MENKLVDKHMDKHLENVQHEAKAALDRFAELGMKIDKRFLGHFLKSTIDRLTHTCDRYSIESRWKITDGMSNASAAKTTETITSSPSEGTRTKPAATSIPTSRPTPGTARTTLPATPPATPRVKATPIAKAPAKLTATERAKVTTARVNLMESIVPANAPAAKRLLKHPTDASKKKQKLNGTERNTDAHDKDECDDLAFFCFYCLEGNDFNGSASFNGTLDDVYGHWLVDHFDETVSKPFKFCAVPSVRCLHCDDVGMFFNMAKHHGEKHADKPFAITNRADPKKCGICHYKDGDLFIHFVLNHNSKWTKAGFSPIYYSEERIDKLLTVNVQKRYQCGKCEEVMKTHDEIVRHFATSHAGHAVQSTQIVANRSKPEHLICGFCRKVVGCTRLLKHFREHSYNFPCTIPSDCSYKTEDIAELIYHEKFVHNVDNLNYHCDHFPNWVKDRFFNTDMVFSNGLALKLFNVLETKFDDSKLFDVFIDNFLEVKREQAKKKIESIETNVNAIDTLNNSSNPIRLDSGSASIPIMQIRLPQLSTALPATLATVFNSQRSTFGYPSNSLAPINHRTTANTVFVYGIYSRFNIRNLFEIFLKFCRILNVYMTRGCIAEIVQCNNGILVKFHQISTARMVTSQTTDRFVWMNCLINSFMRNEQTRSLKVYVDNSLTPTF